MEFGDYFTVELQDPMGFSPVWLIVAAALVIAAVLMWVFLRKKLPRRIPRAKKPAAPAQMSEEDLTSLKKLYLEKMARTEQELRDGKLTIREAYQRMSADMREFVKRATGVPVREMTLAEISELKIPSLTELVRDYYEPEFAYYSEADAHRSFERTCQVIRKWARTWMVGQKEKYRQKKDRGRKTK